MIVMIDNYDSFTYNLVDYLQQLGAHVQVFRNDCVSVAEIAALQPTLIVLSPGPKAPSDAGVCLDVVEAFYQEIPMLGVCLGHQSIAQAFGAKIVKAPTPVHGKVSAIAHSGTGMFVGLANPLNVARYHSLVVEATTLPKEFIVLATTTDGLIMAYEHQTYPLQAVQFHPESIASESGLELLKNAYQKALLYKGGLKWSSLNAHVSTCDRNN